MVCQNVPKEKKIGMSLDKNAMMCQQQSYMRFAEDRLTISPYKNATMSLFLYTTLFPDRKATVNRERSDNRFQNEVYNSVPSK